ncbi:hypothetical protein ACFWB1_32790 [Streptomyces goshikiensis]|uniref:hypothetical protein n=1 Tax=Streptomyces goshikiensis TaxID=1942 RepID=UPI0036A69572
MMVNDHGLPLAGTLVARDHEDWSAELRAEFAANAHNGRVGGRLLSETDRVRVWEIRLAPGERLPAHRHVLDYFWTALTAGRGRQHTADGTTREVTYEAGETRHFTFGPGEFLLHDLENCGHTPLLFTTVEFKDAGRPQEGADPG